MTDRVNHWGVDSTGARAAITIYTATPTSTDALNIAEKIRNLCDLEDNASEYVNSVTPTEGSADGTPVNIAAELHFTNVLGDDVYVYLPAAKDSCFTLGGAVLPIGTMGSLIAWIEANGTDAFGNDIDAYIDGFRVQRDPGRLAILASAADLKSMQSGVDWEASEDADCVVVAQWPLPQE